MKKGNIKIDVQATVGRKLMYVGCKDAFAYDSNGVKIATPIGMTYDVVLADDEKGFDHLDVTIEGASKDTLPELKEGNVQITLEGLEISLSVYNGQLHAKGKAKGIKPASANKTEAVGQGGAKLGH